MVVAGLNGTSANTRPLFDRALERGVVYKVMNYSKRVEIERMF
jgi:hypothetical protein